MKAVIDSEPDSKGSQGGYVVSCPNKKMCKVFELKKMTAKTKIKTELKTINIYSICPNCNYKGRDFKFKKMVVCPKCKVRCGL